MKKIKIIISVLFGTFFAFLITACGEKQHVHDLVEHVKKEATCTVDGNIEYYHCSKCNKNFLDEKGINEVSDIVIKASHEYGSFINEIASTCSKEGIKGHYECSSCHKYFDENKSEITNVSISKEPHEIVKHDGKEATFTENGYEAYETCKNCDYTTYKEIPMKVRETPVYLNMSILDDNSSNYRLLSSNKRKIETLYNHYHCDYDWTMGDYYGHYYGCNHKHDKFDDDGVGKLNSIVDVVGSEYDFYCTNKNSQVTIVIKFKNTDNCEIMSLTLNGTKYQVGMSCWNMIDMETLYLTINVGNVEGIQDYTIDAIKYIDNERIKDVKMEGDRHVYVGVYIEEQPNINVISTNIGINTINLSFEIKDNKNLVKNSNGKILCALYDGQSILYYEDVTNKNKICFSNLKSGITYQYVFAGYYDNFDGNGFTSRDLLNNYILTEDAVLFDKINVGFREIEFDYKWNENLKNKSIDSLTLYDANDNRIAVYNDLKINNLSPNTEYTISANYSVDGYSDSIFLTFKTNDSKTIEYTDCTYELSYDGTAKIVKYNKNDKSLVSLPRVVKDEGFDYVVTKIDKEAFARHNELELIEFPEKLELIDEYAFYECRGLKYIILPSKIKSIGSYAFYNSSYIDFIYLPKSIEKISNNTFFDLDHAVCITEQTTLYGYDNTYRTISWVHCLSIYYEEIFYLNFGEMRTIKSVSGLFFEDNKVYALCDAYEENYETGKKHAELVHDYSNNNKVTIGSKNINGYELTAIVYAAYYNNNSLLKIKIDSNIDYLGGRAFENCKNLENVELSKSINTIMQDTFRDCESLKKVDSLKYVQLVEKYAFANCISLNDVYLDSINVIGESAFENCSSATRLTIGVIQSSYATPITTINISTHAFYGCSSLTRLNLPISVENIGIDAFAGCPKLVICSLYERRPDFYDSYYDSDFGGSVPIIWGAIIDENGICYSLKNGVARVVDVFDFDENGSVFIVKDKIVINNIYDNYKEEYNVTAIDNGAFKRLDGIYWKHVIIPRSINYISDDFYHYDFHWLYGEDITITNDFIIGRVFGELSIIKCISDKDIRTITIPKSINGIEISRIDDHAFDGFYKLVEIINNSKVYNNSINTHSNIYEYSVGTYIHTGDSAIFEYGDFKFVKIDANYYLYDYVGNDTKIVLPELVNGSKYYLANNVFKGNNDITSVYVSSGVIGIGMSAFENCKLLKEIIISDGVTKIGIESFNNCISLEKLLIGNDVENIDEVNFDGCEKLQYNKYDNGLYIGNEINPYLILMRPLNREITSLVLNEKTKYIRSCSFQGCGNLTNIIISKSVAKISKSSFAFCRNLTNVTICEGVTSIEYDAFSGCNSLTSITLPSSVTSVGSSAFSGCKRLESITISNAITTIGVNAFNDCKCIEYNGALYLGNKTNPYLVLVSVDKSINKLEINSQTSFIQSSAFLGCSSLTNITIPEGVTSIGNSAFSDCSSLTNITIPEGVTSIGDNVFYRCSSLTIFCKSLCENSGWSSKWNSSNCLVVWGYEENNGR